MNDIRSDEWKDWVERRHAGNRAETREKFINVISAFQTFAVKHHKLAFITEFERDSQARNPRRRTRRQVDNLSPKLIGLLMESAHISIKDATVKRFYYETHDQLRSHLSDFVMGYNFAKRLKTLKGLTPYEYICKLWTKEPDRFILDPLHHMPGLNI